MQRHEQYKEKVIQMKEEFHLKTKELRELNAEKLKRNNQNQEFID